MTRGALYAQAVRGPLVLITVGVLFALHQSGAISFARTWPLIIIVVGVVKLAERLLAPPAALNPVGVNPTSANPGAVNPGGAARL